MQIVILNEPNYRAGGIESIYQLCHTINESGGEGYIYFINRHSNPVPDEYKKYNIRILDEIIDEPGYLYIIPEAWTGRLDEISKAKKAIWWLSVDNNYDKFQSFGNDDIIHFYQSEYAKNFLIKNGTKNVYPIHDYIEGVEYDGTVKYRVVCYNPVKGREAAEYVIRKCPDITFIPLVNMTKEQITDALKRSMIYIDFGHHPGRDRIPREAALLHNIILTSRIGSAEFYEDIPILDIYKYPSLSSTIKEDITHYLDNYYEKINDFEFYRTQIQNQKLVMREEVDNILGIL